MNELIYDDDDVRRRRTYITGFSVTFLRKYQSVFRRPHDDDVRRRESRDDDVRRRRTYITGFSVTFVCKYLTVFLTRCCYTVNELIYDENRL